MQGKLTLVVSPLISLMDDQVATLQRVGIPAGYIGATLRVDQALPLILANRLRVLYITPEMCSRVPDFFAQIRESEFIV